MERFKQKLQAAAIPFRENEPLAAHCTFKIGGPAQLFVMPENEQQLCSAVALCKEQAVRYYLLGNGSNILFADEGFSGVVIDVSALDAEIAVEDTVLTAGAGVRLAALCKAALKHGLSGLEFAYGIPGTVGGAVYMNAGAYKDNMANHLVDVCVLKDNTICWMKKDELDYAYRHSIFQSHKDWTILVGRFQLEKGNQNDIRDLMDARRERRMSAQPLNKPCAGSVFRNPEEIPAWKLIEDLGLRGHKVGGAKVSEKHCNFIVNDDLTATAQDVRDLIHEIKVKAKKEYDIDMVTEVEQLYW